MSLEITQINSFQDVMSPTFPKNIFRYFNKGQRLYTEWSSPQLMNYAGFQPTTVYTRDKIVVGVVVTTPDGHDVVMYGWSTPRIKPEVQKQLRGLHTVTFDDGPPPVETPTILIQSEQYGPEGKKHTRHEWQFV